MTTTTRLSPKDVLDALSRHILVDGYHVVMDMEQSHGSYLFDARSGRPLLDFFTNFATMPIGYNHPKMADPEMRERLLQAALTKPTNSDIYTADYAEFVETFARLAIPASHAGHLFFVEGGALGVENALKTAFDWKVRKNLARGLGEEKGKQILHFRNAFHGRIGICDLAHEHGGPAQDAILPGLPVAPPDHPEPAVPGDAKPCSPKSKGLEDQAEGEIRKACTRQPERHRRADHRADPGRGRRQPLPPGVPPPPARVSPTSSSSCSSSTRSRRASD